MLQVAKLNDAERELSEISERLKASSKGKEMTQTFIEHLPYVVHYARYWATMVYKMHCKKYEAFLRSNIAF